MFVWEGLLGPIVHKNNKQGESASAQNPKPQSINFMENVAVVLASLVL